MSIYYFADEKKYKFYFKGKSKKDNNSKIDIWDF